MSRLPSTKANAAKGTAIRAAGFQTGIHANPQVKEFIDTNYKNGKTITVIYRDGANKFSKDVMPSEAAIRNYIKNYLTKELTPPTVVEVPVYAPNYLENIRNWDIYVKALDRVKVLTGLLDKEVERSGKVNFTSQIILELSKEIRETEKLVWEMEAKMGFRGANAATPVGITVNNNSLTINATTGTQADEWDEDDKLMLDNLIKTQKQLERQHNAPEPSSEQRDATEAEIL